MMKWHTVLFVLVLGRFTTSEEIDYAIELIQKSIGHLRDMSPLWEMFKDGIDLDSIEWGSSLIFIGSINL